ncbi:alpha/beta-hydrolase [Schizopora paradoxa]|uniref:Alpha/beta-hydrolase n=1 Tax=Schizopora paradoxa TaxID=27342 RepID=A0A0H2RM51_9AGAM|nr:alpha/beta-hydrolase [Schizopora paradoxa]
MSVPRSSFHALRSSCIRNAIRYPSFASKFSRRAHSTALPLELKHEVFSPDSKPDPTTTPPLMILHGLFGSKRNWHSLAKAFAKQLNRPVYALDLRNHGDSPHGEPMDYTTMANDVIHFCNQNSLRSIHLLGHSMGGKVAMALALDQDRPRDLLSSLVVADISPIRGKISPEFQRYADGMIELEKLGVKSRKEAFDKLAEYEEDISVRQFLLTNLATTLPQAPLKFKIPLDIINDAISNIGWFPYEPGDVTWDGPTLFMRGSRSNYIKLKHMDLIKQFFPRMSLETLDASHWLHAERPKDFLDAITQFIDKSRA